MSGEIVAEFDSLDEAGEHQKTLGPDFYVSAGVERCYSVRKGYHKPTELLVAIDEDAAIINIVEALAMAGFVLQHRHKKPPLLRLRTSESEKTRHRFLDQGMEP